MTHHSAEWLVLPCPGCFLVVSCGLLSVSEWLLGCGSPVEQGHAGPEAAVCCAIHDVLHVLLLLLPRALPTFPAVAAAQPGCFVGQLLQSFTHGARCCCWPASYQVVGGGSNALKATVAGNKPVCQHAFTAENRAPWVVALYCFAAVVCHGKP